MIEGKIYIGMDLDHNFLIQDKETKIITTLNKNDLNPYTIDEQYKCLLNSLIRNHPFQYLLKLKMMIL
jgi:hypothetical protein